MKLRVGDLRSLIAEAIKRSDVDNVVRSLENAASKVGVRVKADVDTSKSMFNVFVRFVSGDESLAEDTLGWALLSRSDRRGLVWWFEPSHETKGSLKRNKIPDTLFHITRAENVDSIMSSGLRPGSRSVPGTSRRYSPRVYLATRQEDARATAKAEQDWTMLAIDVTKLQKMKFFIDQEFGFRSDGTPIAVYTNDGIPPSALSVV